MSDSDQDTNAFYSEEETARRRDEAIKRALRTPPKPMTAKDKPKEGARRPKEEKPDR